MLKRKILQKLIFQYLRMHSGPHLHVQKVRQRPGSEPVPHVRRDGAVRVEGSRQVSELRIDSVVPEPPRRAVLGSGRVIPSERAFCRRKDEVMGCGCLCRGQG